MAEATLHASGHVDADQLQRPKATTYDIPELVRLSLAGVIRVPRFQRAFVWDANDVRKLFDSIWRGFPIGTLLLWRHHADAGRISFGPLEWTVSEQQQALWVVDGQQRVTSLIGVLSEVGGSVDERFDVLFDLRRKRFVTAGRKPVPPTWLPLREALETRTLLAWLRDHEDDLEPTDLDLADALGGALRDYQIPAYVVEGEDDRVLREVFDRINSAGKPISRAEVFHALFAQESEPGSPSTVVEALRRLNFGQIDADRVVQSLLALRGGDVARDVHDEFDASEDPADWYELTQRALEGAIQFLRDQGVLHVLLAPSTLPLPVLAAFFHLHPDPDPWTRRLLARWLWRGWVHGFGRRGQTPALRQAVRVVNPKKGVPELAPSASDAALALLELVPDEPPSGIIDGKFRTDTAAGRLVLLALASLKPQKEDGIAIGIVEGLEARGWRAFGQLVPASRADVGARGFWPEGARPLTGYEPPSVLQSHAVPEDAAAGLRTGDVHDFLERRRERLAEVVESFLTVRLEANGLRRPPLRDLIVDEAEPEIDE